MPDRQTLMLEAAVRVIARDGVRGLRVEKLAAEAGVSTALIYYHFKDRAGLLRHTLAFVNDRAAQYTREARTPAADPRAELELLLLLELQDTQTVRENSTAWGELRASSIFNPELREPVRQSTEIWTNEIADAIRRVRASVNPVDAAEHLTTLIEGLSQRWLSGSITLDRAQTLLKQAISAELGPH